MQTKPNLDLTFPRSDGKQKKKKKKKKKRKEKSGLVRSAETFFY